MLKRDLKGVELLSMIEACACSLFVDVTVAAFYPTNPNYDQKLENSSETLFYLGMTNFVSFIPDFFLFSDEVIPG